MQDTLRNTGTGREAYRTEDSWGGEEGGKAAGEERESVRSHLSGQARLKKTLVAGTIRR